MRLPPRPPAFTSSILNIIDISPTGNRIGHHPGQPQLSPAIPIRKGKGGPPRILSLAAEKAKDWYSHPAKCKPLCTHHRRQTRSERREAYQIILEAILSHLELATMSLGTPTLSGGFIDLPMSKLVQTAGMSQRRCERAIRDLKQAGFMEVRQPRKINAEGKYVGLRAVRVVTPSLFEWLGLGPMLERERKNALERLKMKALQANQQLKNLLQRMGKKSLPLFGLSANPARPGMDEERQYKRRRWREVWRGFVIQGIDFSQAQRQTNLLLGYSEHLSPAML